MNNTNIDYIKNEEYKIYEKSLQYKCSGTYKKFYFVVKENEIIDILRERIVGEIQNDRLSNDNIEIIVYKCIEQIGDKYYSFRKRNFEYKFGELIKSKDPKGIFFCKSLKEATTNSYEGYKNRVIIKAKVKMNDLVGADERNLEFSKCIPIDILEGDNY